MHLLGPVHGDAPLQCVFLRSTNAPEIVTLITPAKRAELIQAIDTPKLLVYIVTLDRFRNETGSPLALTRSRNGGCDEPR